MRGITLIALGTYIKWAFQMAVSIKHYSDIKIQLLHDGSLSSLHSWQQSFFDYDRVMDKKDSYLDGKVFPALAKLSMNRYFEFDETIYLDVDSVCVRDLNSLFPYCTQSFCSQIFGTGVEGEAEYDKMYWAYPKDLWEHFDIPKGFTIPFINSSFQYVQKGKQTEALFSHARNLLTETPFPVPKLRYAFGRGVHATKQPDELYMDVALAQLEMDCVIEVEPFYFSNKGIDSEDYIKENHWLIGLYGKKRDHTHTSVMKYYDRLIQNMMHKHGQGILYKSDQLMRTKFIDTK